MGFGEKAYFHTFRRHYGNIWLSPTSLLLLLRCLLLSQKTVRLGVLPYQHLAGINGGLNELQYFLISFLFV